MRFLHAAFCFLHWQAVFDVLAVCVYMHRVSMPHWYRRAMRCLAFSALICAFICALQIGSPSAMECAWCWVLIIWFPCDHGAHWGGAGAPGPTYFQTSRLQFVDSEHFGVVHIC